MLFSWFDLVFPIGTALLAAVLGVWAAMKATDLPGKLVSIATAIVFCVPIPVLYTMRSNANAHDYVLPNYEIYVVQGEKNKCAPEDVKKWTEWVVSWWSDKYKTGDVLLSLKGKRLICVDEEKITAFQRFMRGFSWGRQIVIGYNGKPEYTESLFKHEAGHFVLYGAGKEPKVEADQHKKMKEIGYPY